MSPSMALREHSDRHGSPVDDGAPPPKRLRFASPVDDRDASSRSRSKGADGEILPHPLHIRPCGNSLMASYNLRDTSTGLFAILPDELILQLLGYLDAQSLVQLGNTSKGMYGFCRSEELWRPLFIESPESSQAFEWQGTWRRTHLRLSSSQESQIPLPNLFSDVLYRPYHMSQISLSPYTRNIPPKNQIQTFTDISADSFETHYSSIPFILTSPIKQWPGFQTWSLDYLVTEYGDIKFQAESVNWRLRDYVAYMNNQSDESPLYLFDKSFAEKTDMESGFSVPEWAGKDYFELLGEQRPDRRWMILGPERSGSTFHKDPNATSAWNAVIFGEKYWIMFPPDTPPPGVFVSEDQSEVTSPLSIAEWFVSFHKAARKTPGCIEGICRAGEILHVPSGWWHLVVNLDASLALTQNFVPKKKLPAVLGFLRDQACSVSGFDTTKVLYPYGLFVERMREKYPDELDAAMAILDKSKRSKWEELVKSDGGGGFSFGFVGDDSDDD